MRTLGIILLCILAVIGGGVAWCKISYPAYTYRYRMTVEVTVNGVVHSGSSVVEVTVQKQPEVGDAPAQVSHVRGEAVFVDLGDGRNVIALLASGPNGSDVDYPYGLVPRLFRTSYDEHDLPKLAGLRGRRDIPENKLPTFVTFADLNDPKSVRVVKSDEFSQVFGPNVRLSDARIEMTNEPVTRGIEQKMPEIAKRLREKDKVMQIKDVRDPYSPRSGHFFIK